MTLTALSIPFLILGFASKALSALFLSLLPRSLAIFGIISVTVPGSSF